MEVESAKRYYAAIITLANRQGHMREIYNTAINCRIELRNADATGEQLGKIMVASSQAVVTALCPRSYGDALLEAFNH